ncbi:hypothetical protein PVL29_022838 [Vitis rotundifolia]|uniref:Uncharacterized protein n=1 Tax=Vitis rotundifolia TaxID=103349 RepID=A0AA38YWN4_VITRO|nr:hypothetical protein PVL29_022838 [Vitis rotundifolia]
MDLQIDQRWQQLTNINEVCGNGSSHQEQMAACFDGINTNNIVLSSTDFIQNQMQSGYLSRSHREETGFKPREVPKESRMYLEIHHQQCSHSHISRLHLYSGHLGARHPHLVTYFLSCELTHF